MIGYDNESVAITAGLPGQIEDAGYKFKVGDPVDIAVIYIDRTVAVQKRAQFLVIRLGAKALIARAGSRQERRYQ